MYPLLWRSHDFISGNQRIIRLFDGNTPPGNVIHILLGADCIIGNNDIMVPVT